MRPWVMEDGEKTYVGKSKNIAHCITGNLKGKTTNPKKISVNKSSATLGVGQTVKLKGTVKGVKSGKKLLDHGGKVQFKSADSRIARVASNGVVTAVSAGSCKIYVLTSNGIYKAVKITVKPGPESIGFEDSSYSVKKGKTLKLTSKLQIVPEDGIKTTYTWKSSNKKIAKVDKNGKVKGVKKGTVTITVKTSNGKSAKVKVKVK